jgi:hypothetical protein
VLRIAGLAGTPIHATPLYSIACNLLTALVTARLWTAGAPLSTIGGVFLLLNGFGRFVEEAYRGEPQTPVFAGLHFYQWIAIGTVVAGAAVTTIRTTPAPGSPGPDSRSPRSSVLSPDWRWGSTPQSPIDDLDGSPEAFQTGASARSFFTDSATLPAA